MQKHLSINMKFNDIPLVNSFKEGPWLIFLLLLISEASGVKLQTRWGQIWLSSLT